MVMRLLRDPILNLEVDQINLELVEHRHLIRLSSYALDSRNTCPAHWH